MLSSDSLFHFTHDLETLQEILASGFKPFYSSEDLTMFGVKECPGIPMICFCDIPLSLATKHVADYGRYAIGMDKKWGMSKNVAPVHYIYKDSICATVISKIYESLPRDAFYANCECMKFDTQTAIFFYGKPYRGQLRRKDVATGAVVEKGEVIFYNEREWRYVPFADHTMMMEEIPSGVRTMLSQIHYEEAERLAKATTSLHEHYRLKFVAEDVRYLIVGTEEEIPKLVDFIESIDKNSGNSDLGSCTPDEKKRLMTRLISMQQIERDF